MIKNDCKSISLLKNKQIWQEVLEFSERHAAVIAMAALDIQLTEILDKYLIKNKDLSRTIEGSYAKIQLCYSLGLIPSDVHHDLLMINKIRNDFAHDLKKSDFSHTDIKSKLADLRLRKYQDSKGVVPPRAIFNSAILTLSTLLEICYDRVNPITPNLKIFIDNQLVK